MQPQTYQPVKQPNKKLAAIALVLFTVMAIFIVFAVVLAGSDYSDKVGSLVAQQTETARVAQLVVNDKTASPNTKALAITLELSASSNVVSLAGVKGGNKVDDKIIKAAEDSTADSLLDEAKQNNQYNDTFSEIAQIKINQSITIINDLLTESLEADEKVLLETMLEDLRLLLDSI